MDTEKRRSFKKLKYAGKLRFVRSKGDVATELETCDQNTMYGLSLSVGKINRLIKEKEYKFVSSGFFRVDSSNGRDMLALRICLRNLSCLMETLNSVRITKETLKKSRITGLYKDCFNAWWTDYDFSPPTATTIIGSASLGYLTSNNRSIDIAITLSSEMFNPKDYINYRYINKRNSYVEELFFQLQNNSEAIVTPNEKTILDLSKEFNVNEKFLSDTVKNLHPSLDIVCWQGGDTKIVVQITVNRRLSGEPDRQKMIKIGTFNIIPCLSMFALKDNSLMPDRNNVRIPTTLIPQIYDLNHQNATLPPTPSYNGLILEDLHMLKIHSALVEIFHKYSDLSGAVILLKHWANQRGLMQEALNKYIITSCISGFIFAYIAAHVCSVMDFPCDTNAFSIFVSTLKFIASMDINRYIYMFGILKPVERHKDADSNVVSNNRRSNTEIERIILPEFYDCESMAFNVLFRTVFTFSELVQCSQHSVIILAERNSPLLYTQLFDMKYGKKCFYDSCIYIDLPQRIEKPFNGLSKWWEFSRAEYLAFDLKFLLEYGLQDRLNLLHFRFINCCTNHNGLYAPQVGLCVFISFNEAIQRLIDIGPLTNSEEFAFFRKFWKGKAETRRFDDGSINECVLWEDTTCCRDSTIGRLFGFQSTGDRNKANRHSYSINSHILDELMVSYLSDSNAYEIVLTNKKVASPTDDSKAAKCVITHMQFPVEVRIFTNWRSSLISAYNYLNIKLRSLEHIPIRIMNIYMADEYFAYCDVGPTAYSFGKGYQSVHIVNILFESSTAWPTEPEAIEKVKVAFCVTICKELFRNHGIKSRIRETGIMEIYIGTFNFVVNICYSKELTYLVKLVESFDPNTTKIPSHDQIGLLRNFWFKQKYTELIRTVALKNPAFSNSVKLAKLWAAACLVPDADFICEMICGYVFSSNNFMLPLPQSANVGFTRFLYILANYSWESKPLIVDLTDNSPTKKYDMGILNIEKNAHTMIPYIWISIKEDPYSLIPKIPNEVMCRRFIQQSRELLHMTEQSFIQGSLSHSISQELDPLARFGAINNLEFDLVICMHNPYFTLKYGADSKVCNREFLSPEDLGEAKFIAAEIIRNLEQYIGEIAYLAYDQYELQGITFPRDEKGLRSEFIRFYLKFNPFAFIPSTSIRPKSYPQVAVYFDRHREFLNAQEGNSLLSKSKVESLKRNIEDPVIVIPHIPLVINTIITVFKGLLTDIKFI